MKTVLCWSAGKDSTATGILAKDNGIHIDEIVTVMPDPFKKELELKEAFEDYMGMSVVMIDGPSFEEYFFMKKTRGKYVGTIYGWPFTAYKTCARVMKWDPMKKHFSGQDICFLIGIATNENRKILKPNRSLLKEFGLSENDARELCIKHGLLNPLYKHFKRMGCVRCPKQGRAALEKVREMEPEKFKWMIDNDEKSPVTFKPYMTFKSFIGIGETRHKQLSFLDDKI